MTAARASQETSAVAESSAALWLCVIGLLGVFAVGYPGYFVFDAIWPGYYYSPCTVGKNAWLLGQALFIAVYFAGALLMFGKVGARSTHPGTASRWTRMTSSGAIARLAVQHPN